MSRTVRGISLLKWTVVAMHTAIVVSMSVCLMVWPLSRSERTWARAMEAALTLIDLPVVLLTLPVVYVFRESSQAPAFKAVLFATAFVLLGGVQWYVIASLIGRWTFGFQKSLPVASRRVGTVALVCILLVCGSAIIPWAAKLERVHNPRIRDPYTPPSVAFEGESKDLRESVIVPTLDTPIPRRRNVVWCGTFQLSWNCLARDVLHSPPDIKHAETVASRLNRARLVEGDLPPGAYLAKAGFVREGVVDVVRSEMGRRFNKAVKIDPMEPNDILAYAYLNVSAAFTVPFLKNHEALRFRDSSGRETGVTSFGVGEKDEYGYEDLREKVEVLYFTGKATNPGEADEFAVDVCRDSSPSQIIVACLPRRATLSETIREMEQKTQEFARRPYAEHDRKFGIRDVLAIPNLNWEVQHHFAEIEGSDKRFLNSGFNKYYVAKAMQAIRFRLDRSGVELASQAEVACKAGARQLVCDRPFLIVVKKRDATLPFFVMWVDNGELLSKP